MKPHLTDAYKNVAIGSAICLAVALGGLWFGWDRGQLKDQHQTQREAYQSRIGALTLADLVSEYEQAVITTQEQINELKGLVGMSPVAPFLKPRRDSGGYIAYLIRFLHQELQLKAQTFTLDPRLGFNLLSTSPPREEEASGWLTMLQLVTKALFLCTEAPGIVDEVVVTKLTTNPIRTGPQGRPPLLEEYPFSLRITASLESVSWLLQQFSSDARTPGNKDEDLANWLGMIERGVEAARFTVVRPEHEMTIGPLIVRGFQISGSRIEDNRISRLTVDIDLAGMEFLSDEQRGDVALTTSDRRSNNQPSNRARSTTARSGGTKPMARP